MKNVIVAMAAVLVITACAALEQAGDWVNDNPLVADLVVRQSVARYIDAGDTQVEKSQRAADVKTVIERTTTYLDGNPQTGVAGIMDALNANIAWDRLSAADRLLVQDIMLMVQLNLAQKQAEDQLAADTALAVRSLLRTAVSAASLFL